MQLLVLRVPGVRHSRLNLSVPPAWPSLARPVRFQPRRPTVGLVVLLRFAVVVLSAVPVSLRSRLLPAVFPGASRLGSLPIALALSFPVLLGCFIFGSTRAAHLSWSDNPPWNVT